MDNLDERWDLSFTVKSRLFQVSRNDRVLFMVFQVARGSHSSHFSQALLRASRDSEIVGRGGEREAWNKRDSRLEINEILNKQDLK